MKNKLVEDVMTSPAITCESTTIIKDAIDILVKENIGFLPITKNNILVGVATDRDILVRTAKTHQLDIPIENIMSGGELHFTHPKTPLEEAAKVMADHKIRRLVVLDDGKVSGVLTTKHLLNFPELYNYVISTYTKSSTLPHYQIYANSNPHDSVKTADFPL